MQNNNNKEYTLVRDEDINKEYPPKPLRFKSTKLQINKTHPTYSYTNGVRVRNRDRSGSFILIGNDILKYLWVGKDTYPGKGFTLLENGIVVAEECIFSNYPGNKVICQIPE